MIPAPDATTTIIITVKGMIAGIIMARVMSVGITAAKGTNVVIITEKALTAAIRKATKAAAVTTGSK